MSMGITISFGIQKGGVGKTTTTSITSYLLAKDAKVLAIDFDSQGNLTAMLTGENIYHFTGKSILEACQERDPKPYIYPVHENLHVLPAEDHLVTFSRYVSQYWYQGDTETSFHVLRETIESVKNDYDYIVIDLPPNVGDQTLNGLTASDYAVVLLQSDPFCYDALDRYLEILAEVVDRANPDLKMAGILTSMLDARASLDKAILEQARTDYADRVFETVIRRKSRIKEFSISGVTDHTKLDREALKTYQSFVKELKAVVQRK